MDLFLVLDNRILQVDRGTRGGSLICQAIIWLFKSHNTPWEDDFLELSIVRRV